MYIVFRTASENEFNETDEPVLLFTPEILFPLWQNMERLFDELRNYHLLTGQQIELAQRIYSPYFTGWDELRLNGIDWREEATLDAVGYVSLYALPSRNNDHEGQLFLTWTKIDDEETIEFEYIPTGSPDRAYSYAYSVSEFERIFPKLKESE